MQLLLNLIEHYGLWLVFANVLATQLGVPVPVYPTLIAVAAASSRSSFDAMQIVAVGVLASLAADLVWFRAGMRYGRRVLGLMCRISLSPDSCVQQSEDLFDRWGRSRMPCSTWGAVSEEHVGRSGGSAPLRTRRSYVSPSSARLPNSRSRPSTKFGAVPPRRCIICACR